MEMKTVLISYLISNLICVGVVGALYWQNRRHFKGIGFWLADFVLQFAAILLATLRGIVPDFIAMVVGNGFAIGGTILLYMGLEQFTGKRGTQWHNAILFILFLFVHSYFAIISPNLTARNINLAFALFVICAQGAWLLLCKVDIKLRPITHDVGIVFTAYCLVNAGRIAVSLTIPSGENFFQSNLYEISAVMAYQMLFIALTFSLFLMVNRRLLMELQEDIAMRQQTEDALRFSKEKFYKAFHSSPDLVAITLLSDGSFVEVNESFSQITGYSRKEMLNSSITTLDIWANRQDRESFIQLLKTEGVVRAAEYKYRTKSGEIRTGLLSAEIIQLGNEPHIVSVIHDITEHKHTEAALRESRETLALFINQSPIYTYIKEVTPTQSRVIYASENFADMIGIPGSEMVGKTMEELFPAEFAAKITADDWAVASGKEILNQEEELNGHQYITIKFPLLRTGRVNLLAGYTIDITERKQAEKLLRESEERFRQLITSAPDVVFVVDEKGKITFANMEATNLMGYAPDEFIGMAVEKLMPQNIRGDHIANRTKYMRDPHTRLMEAQLNLLATHKDGNEIPVDIKISPVNIDGKTHIVAFMRDITMRKQADEKLRESEEKYRLIVETAHEGIWVLDTDGKTSYANTRMAEMLGYKIEDLIGHSLFEFMDDDARKEAEQMLERRRKGVAEQHEFRFRHKDGSPFWAILSTSAIIDSDSKFIGALGMITDITERKQAEEKLLKAKKEAEESETRFRKSLEYSPTPMAVADHMGKMIFLNQNFIATYGYTLQDIPSIDQWMLKAYPDPEYRNFYLQLWKQDSEYAVTNNTATPLREGLVTCKSGEVKTVAILIFFEKDLIIGHFLDISERVRTEGELRTSNETLKTQFNEINTLKETLQEQAIRDPLTGLHNRRYLDETLAHEVARAKRENYPISIMLIDIDRFKNFNDTYGHSTGDEVLKSLSRLLVESIRQGDIACRYGGEEFLIVMVSTHETDVERRAEKIRHDFNELRTRFENQELSATVSIGVSYYPRHGTEIQQVIKNADAAMYQAKQKGRNRVYVWGT